MRGMARLIRARMEEKNGLMQIVVGPRQVGKTTAIRQALDGRGVYFSADSPTPYPVSMITDYWHQACASEAKIIAIDEVQKIPQWSEEVKRLWDLRQEEIHVILSGSSSLGINRGLSESLAGRFELIRAEHWNAKEAKELLGIDCETFVDFGCYPGAEPLRKDLERWGAYIRDSIIEPVLGRDILQLYPVENPALLRELFAVAITLPAQVISLQKIQGQLQIKGAVATISKYLQLLGQAFLVSSVQKYFNEPFRVRQSSPKLIVHDNALIRAFERPITASLKRERRGRYFENAIGARLIESGWEVFYWKERQLEVDFVALGPKGEKWALEVKLSPPAESELAGLRKFCHLHPDFSPHLVCLYGSVKEKTYPGVELLAAEDVLKFSRT